MGSQKNPNSGFRGLGFRGLGVRGLGFKGLGFLHIHSVPIHESKTNGNLKSTAVSARDFSHG